MPVATLAARLAEAAEGLDGRRVLVAIDGPDAAGKTTLASAVAGALVRPVVQVTMDSWHHPREVRLRRGGESPDGYYLDSFDLEALLSRCLLPFRSGASQIQTSAFVHASDSRVPRKEDVPSNSVLLVDGVFLLRPELRDLWDLTVYLHVPEPVSIQRALTRDRELLGTEDAVRRRYTRRYLPGQALYRNAADPLGRADVVIDNTDPERPVVVRWRDPGPPG